MTNRIYYHDSYTTEFSASVTSRSADGLRATLDRTALYPTSGGQQHDTGSLNDAAVIDVIDEGEKITHVLDTALAGNEVAGRVNWERRFDHMQQHTGQHLLSAVFEDLFGFRTASVHFGADSSSLDLETVNVTREQLLEAERRSNETVFENRPVSISFENAATAQGLRKPPPREGEVRIITIENLDRSACGGTHVRATGEIGPILLGRQEKMHGNTRVEFLCGGRAVRRARADYDIIARASAALGVAPPELVDRTAAVANDLRESERLRRKVGEELAKFRAAESWQRATPDANGVRWIMERVASGSLDELRPMAQATMSLERAAFLGVVEDPPQVLLASSADSGVESGKVLKTALAEVGGRGGGSPRLAQGTVVRESLAKLIDILRRGQ